MDIILNKIAIWKAHGSKKLTKRVAPTGTQYLEPNSPIYRNANDKSIIRYAKDYKIGKINYSLFLRTFSEDQTTVEKALDAVAAKLEKAYVLEATHAAGFDNFVYTNFVFDEATGEVK